MEDCTLRNKSFGPGKPWGKYASPLLRKSISRTRRVCSPLARPITTRQRASRDCAYYVRHLHLNLNTLFSVLGDENEYEHVDLFTLCYYAWGIVSPQGGGVFGVGA
jgi:hypothetical protein